MKIHIVIGTRPQYVKLAALYSVLKQKFNVSVIDTGQHYDYQMSNVFLKDLKLPPTNINLKAGSGEHGAVTGMMLDRLEKVWLDDRPDLVMVVGDTNSCLAGALAAAKLGIPIAHVEAGLRSFEKDLPEEINRKIADHLSDLLFTTEPQANINLINEGISEKRIYYVGNVMIDSLRRNLKTAMHRKIWEKYDLKPRSYGVVTLHRPDNVDSAEKLNRVLDSISEGAGDMPLIFPAHLRTRKSLDKVRSIFKGIRITQPLGYLDFMSLLSSSRLVITDSGGIQEESSVLGIPCVTLREVTERPITVEKGTNVLAGSERKTIVLAVRKAKGGRICPMRIPKWDGKTSLRIASTLRQWQMEKGAHD